jgi:gluconolactonase
VKTAFIRTLKSRTSSFMKTSPLLILFILPWYLTLAQSDTTPPAHEIRGPFLWKSQIYPGTERNYWVYVPKQYDASKPACVMVVQDGLSRANGWRLPRVLDSLIEVKQIPVIIGIFVDHGQVPSTSTDNYPRFNRSFEYDALGDRYARFLLEELLPEVSRTYNLSTDPNDRSIAGASSGAICAFNAAWERPNEFRRVLSTIGTYVGLRGGDEFATLVRKTEPKPLRVFLQDGTQDLNIYAGDWWTANQAMLSALRYAGYEVNHAWGEGGGHDNKHSITILADALTWLWKDSPAPVQTHKGMNQRLNLMVEGEHWKEVPLNNLKAEKLAVNNAGEIFFTDRQLIYKIDNQGTIALFANIKGVIGGLSFHNNGNLYVSDLTHHTLYALIEKGKPQRIISNINAEYLAITDKGIYFTEPSKKRVGFYSHAKKTAQFMSLPLTPTGLAVSAEQTFLNVGVADGVFGYSLKIIAEGMLDTAQEYIHYHIPYGETNPGIQGMTVDAENILYSTTKMGVQASDQLGRVNFIFSKPADDATDVKIAGPAFNTFYVSCQGRLFRRKINAKGILPSLTPVKPPKPGL